MRYLSQNEERVVVLHCSPQHEEDAHRSTHSQTHLHLLRLPLDRVDDLQHGIQHLCGSGRKEVRAFEGSDVQISNEQDCAPTRGGISRWFRVSGRQITNISDSQDL